MKMHLQVQDVNGFPFYLVITAAIIADFRTFKPEYVAYVKMIRESFNIGLKEAVDYARIVRALAEDSRVPANPEWSPENSVAACRGNIMHSSQQT